MNRRHQTEQTLVEHLIALKSTVLWSLFFLLVAASCVHAFRGVVIPFLLTPLGQDATDLQFLTPLDPLFFLLKVDFILGFLISLPIIALLIWHFIAPATTLSLSKAIGIIVTVSCLSIVGAGYAYAVVVPIVLSFMSSIIIEGTVTAYTAHGYLHFLLSTTILLVLVFQIPLIIVLLTILQLLDPRRITQYRPYIYSGAFIIAAVITPTTDVITLILVAVPAIAVTEIGTAVARLFVT